MKKMFFAFISIFSIFAIWELLVKFQIIDIQFFPPPSTFIYKSFQLVTGPFFQDHLIPSFFRFSMASLLSIPLACFLGLLTGSSIKFDNFINPLMALTYPLPKVAIFPLILLIFGLGDTSKIFLIAIGMFYLIYINIRSGTKRILSSSLVDIIKVYKVSGWNYYYHFLLKGIYYDFLIGLKAATGYGLLLVVVSEFSISKNGIGHFIWQSWDQFRIIDMFAGIFILSVIGFLLSSFLDFLITKEKQY